MTPEELQQWNEERGLDFISPTTARLHAETAQCIADLRKRVAELESAPRGLEGFAVVTADNLFVGIWKDEETANLVRNRSPSAKGERIVRMLAEPSKEQG